MTPDLDLTGRPTALRDVGLDRFFRPRRVAVIGASDSRPANSGIWRKVRDWGAGSGAEVIPVNPTRDSVDGVRCLSSILDVEGEVDLAVILVGSAVEAFEEVVRKKPAFAVIFAAGFAELGGQGEALQSQLDELVASGDTRLLGPNTNLNAFETFRDDLDGPAIALITQSGHQGRPVVQSQDLAVAISHWAPTGNEADLEFADFCRYFADLDTTGAIAAYVEGFKDGRTMMLAADHAATAGVPLVCVKVGRTDEGSSMAQSHTGHLTGSDRVTSDVFRQLGVIRVDGLDELTDVASTFCRTVGPPSGRARERRVCIYAISGGTGAHMADLVAHAGMTVPELSEATRDELRRHIPDYLRVSNPVDSGGAPSADERGIAILRCLAADTATDLVIVPISGAVGAISERLAHDVVQVASETDKPLFVVWGSPTWDDVYEHVLVPARIPLFRTFANCVTAAAAWFEHHDFRERHTSAFAAMRTQPSTARPGVEHLMAGTGALSELDAKAVVAAYGVPVTRDVLCSSAGDAVRAAEDLDRDTGVVMKVCSADIAHKSDLGLVRIGVRPAEVGATYDDLCATAAAIRPSGAQVDGVLVCERVDAGVECVVGVSRDDVFGPVVMFGLGGVFVEVFSDVAFRVPPFGRAEAHRMVLQTKGSALLQGGRGRPPADVQALVDVIMAVQDLALDFSERLEELDINPLVVGPDGAVAADALVVRRVPDQAAGTSSNTSIEPA